MNILLVSQCSKRALTETRRILDQFAERRGERTWQTAITQAGLDALRRLLRRTARKNTAVACHWIRGRDHSELLWIVGDARQFNREGAVPTNTTTRNVLRADDEHQWHSLQRISLLAALAALLHDLGKATAAFQRRLRPDAPRERNRYRHEWVSVRLFQAFVGHDDDAGWLQRLAAAAADDTDVPAFEHHWLDKQTPRLWCDGLNPTAARHLPFADGELPPLARAVAWLVLTHHRLPTLAHSLAEPASGHLRHGRILRHLQTHELDDALQRLDANWNEPWDADTPAREDDWALPHGLPVRTQRWRQRAARMAQRLLTLPGRDAQPWQDPFVLHTARLTLMLGDHHYSSRKAPEERVMGEPDFPLFANTRDGKPLQRLDEHLLGVEQHTQRLTHALPQLARQLPHLIGHRGLRQRSANPRFRWQDRASDLAAGLRQPAREHGAFIVNLASTGCGKTLGNVRLMNALADPVQGLRCAIAIGLRTLTLQTGRVLQRDLGLGDDELALLVGGSAQRTLFELQQEQEAEREGSASRAPLLDQDNTHVVFEGNDQHPIVQVLGTDVGIRRALAAPLLACTVDQLMPATESLRGGRQIAPMLHLLSRDLILDEPDDFDLADLPALTRLVYWAGLLGARVLLSSATLAPALVEGLFQAYRSGRQAYQPHRGERPQQPPDICCLWVDEFHETHAACVTAQQFGEQHLAFASRRAELLRGPASLPHSPRRLARLSRPPREWQSLSQHDLRRAFAQRALKEAVTLHQAHHTADPVSGKRVSFGLIRMANIDPMIDVAQALYQQGAPGGTHVHLSVYHSRFPLCLRSAIERRLDAVLDRRQPLAAFQLPEMRAALDQTPGDDQLFIVLGSPVTEVGRDHDYDWAVVEPSSMRSLIQLAGRVLRHRPERTPTQPNLAVFARNLRSFKPQRRPGDKVVAFCHPGFESEAYPLHHHSLTRLLAPWLEDLQFPIDARPRLLSRPHDEQQPHDNLIDLEHHRLALQMLPPEEGKAGLNSSSIWQRQGATLTGILQQYQPFRYDPLHHEEATLLPDDDEETLQLHLWERLPGTRDSSLKPMPQLMHRLPDSRLQGANMSAWGQHDVMEELRHLADRLDLSLTDCAKVYAQVSLPDSTQGWDWHPLLGFAKRH